MVLAVVASSLGFFVDLYDIIIVSVVRQASLLSLGVPESELLAKGIWLLNIQTVSYTHLTLPTTDPVEISVVADS